MSSCDRDPLLIVFFFLYLSTIVSSRTRRTAGTSGANGTGSTTLATETSVTLKGKIDTGELSPTGSG